MMDNNHIKPALFRAIILLVFTIPLIISGSYLYAHLSNDSESPAANENSDSEFIDTTSKIEDDATPENPDSTAAAQNTPADEPESTVNTDQNEPNENESVENETDENTNSDNAENLSDEGNAVDSQDTIVSEDISIMTKPYTAVQINLLKTTDQTLYFSAQSFKISNDDKALLDSFIETALMFPEEMISIEGHANGYPNFENSILEQTLSEDRMKAVKKYLEDKGVKAKVIMTFNCGSSQPASLDETTQELNDRVEIYFTDYNARGIQDK
ncbi:OmpA family protein [Fusibacter paucivorans]|uniref:OmpA family protein n=1 Tax=Fusibacter paucivorans TaxID=76009 RepID=A0ABS5PMY0_9FIRM|nr:OmpA family protein [Fusibacter paucivorans]MBS7526539.1 OmpA family protein [Fusibacter paucivorans]